MNEVFSSLKELSIEELETVIEKAQALILEKKLVAQRLAELEKQRQEQERLEAEKRRQQEIA